MRTRNLLYTAVLAVIAACNAEPIDNVSSAEEGTIRITLDTGATRAASNTAIYGNEAAVTGVQVLVFDSAGSLEGYKDLGTSLSGSLKCRAGSGHTVYAVLNAPSALELSSVTSLSALQSKYSGLARDNDPSTSFIMAGSKSSVSVTKDNTTPVAITVSRLVARISCVKITNNLPAAYGALTLNSVFLTNVVARDGFGSYNTSLWQNMMGRKSETPLVSSHIIDGTTYAADAAGLTFATFSSASVANGSSYTTAKRLYCFANQQTTDTRGFATTFTARKTRMVIAATIGGTKYFYPVTLPAVDRNTCYDVEVTINRKGSNDPELEPELGTASVTLTVAGWNAGTAISHTI